MVLETENLCKSFAGIGVVRALSFSINRGTVSSIVGPNGAGKTTLFNIINGFLKQDAGTVRYRGEIIDRVPPEKRASIGIGRLWQDVRLFKNITVLENLLVAGSSHPGEHIWQNLFYPGKVRAAEREALRRADEVLVLLGLEDHYHNLATELSYGQQKLVAIGRLLMGGADLLLLDEPLSGVSPAMIGEILSFVRTLANQGKSVLMIEHNIAEALSISDNVFVMDEGRFEVYGSPSDLAGHRLLQEVYA